MDAKIIEEVVTKIVGEYLKTNGGGNAPSVLKKKIADVKREKFDTGNPSDKVWVTDMFSLSESPRIGCGLMEMDNSSFAWTLNYDEMDVVLEGTLTVETSDGKEVSAKAGEVMYIPKGSSIIFKTPNYAKFIYVVYPADWQSQA